VLEGTGSVVVWVMFLQCLVVLRKGSLQLSNKGTLHEMLGREINGALVKELKHKAGVFLLPYLVKEVIHEVLYTIVLSLGIQMVRFNNGVVLDLFLLRRQ